MEQNSQNPGIEATGSQKQERTFTKEQVNELMQKRVKRSHQAFFDRYGVKDLNELDALFGKSHDYDGLKLQNDELNQKNSDLETLNMDLTKRYAYKVGNINPDRYPDIETYFKGKNLNIDENTLMQEVKTHPEWVNKVATIQSLGSEVTETPTVDEKAEASNIFGVDLTK